jgi:hypothetical protein
MASVPRFLTPNTPTRPTKRRIPPEAWDRHKAEIVQQYRLGGKQGVARALQWILEQRLFDPPPRYVVRNR